VHCKTKGARLSSFLSFSLMRESLSSFFTLLSLSGKNLFLVLSSKSSKSVLMRIFLFFLQAQKRSQKKRKGHERTRSHSHHRHSYRHIFSSLLASSHHQHQQKHTALLLHCHSFYATFCDFTQGEREKVCVCVRERERRSLSESERRVCSFYARGL